MAKVPNGRRGPSTPILKLSLHSATGPTSPPETPTAHAPGPLPFYRYPRALSHDFNIKPVGNGHQFSYRPVLAPEQLSPRSSAAASSSLSPPDVASSSADASLDGRPEPEPDSGSRAESVGSGSLADGESVQDALAGCEFVIEDIDVMDSECEGLDVLRPTEIESIPSRPRSRHRESVWGMMQDLENLHCSNEAASDNDESEGAFLQRRQELRRYRRVSMSNSIGKRTHSELSNSDNDDAGSLEVNDVGSSPRRLHKRLHRGSLLLQDPPEPRIDELEEPDSSEDEYATENSLARELPQSLRSPSSQYARDMMDE